VAAAGVAIALDLFVELEQVKIFLTLPSLYVQQGLCNGPASVFMSHQLTAAMAAFRSAADIT